MAAEVATSVQEAFSKPRCGQLCDITACSTSDRAGYDILSLAHHYSNVCQHTVLSHY